jgi:hypothetical protein
MIISFVSWIRRWLASHWGTASPCRETPALPSPHPGIAVLQFLRDAVAGNPWITELAISRKNYRSLVGYLSGNNAYSMATNLWTLYVNDPRKFVLIHSE